jgi:hypothetical protein
VGQAGTVGMTQTILKAKNSTHSSMFAEAIALYIYIIE